MHRREHASTAAAAFDAPSISSVTFAPVSHIYLLEYPQSFTDGNYQTQRRSRIPASAARRFPVAISSRDIWGSPAMKTATHRMRRILLPNPSTEQTTTQSSEFVEHRQLCGHAVLPQSRTPLNRISSHHRLKMPKFPNGRCTRAPT